MRYVSPETLDRKQLRDVALDDEHLMREYLGALIEDTSRQLPLLEAAIREGNAASAVRLAHYSKGACAGVGASAAAAALGGIEAKLRENDFAACEASLLRLAWEIDRLREASEDL